MSKGCIRCGKTKFPLDDFCSAVCHDLWILEKKPKEV